MCLSCRLVFKTKEPSMSLEVIFLMCIFFIIAVVYSSAGFGGGSSYLAMLSLFDLAFPDFRMIALCCNITVVLSSIILFNKHLKINWRRLWPLVVLSIPLAYIGGMLRISQDIFFILLGGSLFVASLLMFFGQVKETRLLPQYINAVIGGCIGLLSGLVGIGGGIFLSPVLHFSRWGAPKVIAATASVFILVSSISGLCGQISTHGFSVDPWILIPLMCSVFVGGQIGVRTTLLKFSPLTVKRITAFVILIVAIRLLIKYLM